MNKVEYCAICGDSGTMDGGTNRANLWGCEKCGKVFCDACVLVDNEHDESILCNDCRRA